MPTLIQAQATNARLVQTAQADIDLAFFESPQGRLALWLDRELARRYQNLSGNLRDYQSGRELDTSVPWLLEEAATLRSWGLRTLLWRGALVIVVGGVSGYATYRALERF